MLIYSHRLKRGEAEAWSDSHHADNLHASRITPEGRKIDLLTASALNAFIAFGEPAYVGVSWGKDSVVVAHLASMVAPKLPLIHLRPTNHNPDCDAVRDAYLSIHDQTYFEVPVSYGDLHSQGLTATELDKATDAAWYSAIRQSGKPYEGRHVLGIRADESNVRKLRCMIHGQNSPNGCAPISWWTTQDVFAYLAFHDLPVHPAYAMRANGRWPRDRIRVAEIGDTHGTGGGRTEWEREYYGDILRRLEAGRI